MKHVTTSALVLVVVDGVLLAKGKATRRGRSRADYVIVVNPDKSVDLLPTDRPTSLAPRVRPDAINQQYQTNTNGGALV
jgi:hypothetical protein